MKKTKTKTTREKLDSLPPETKTLLAFIANAEGLSGGPFLTQENVSFLTAEAVDEVAKAIEARTSDPECSMADEMKANGIALADLLRTLFPTT